MQSDLRDPDTEVGVKEGEEAKSGEADNKGRQQRKERKPPRVIACRESGAPTPTSTTTPQVSNIRCNWDKFTLDRVHVKTHPQRRPTPSPGPNTPPPRHGATRLVRSSPHLRGLLPTAVSSPSYPPIKVTNTAQREQPRVTPSPCHEGCHTIKSPPDLQADHS